MIQYNIYIGETVYMAVIAVWGIRRRYPLSWFLLAALSGLYFQLLSAYAVFPLVRMVESFILWSPDSFSLDFANAYSTRQIIENLILTLPMGFVLPFLLDQGKRRRFFTVIAFSVGVEMVQLVGVLLRISFHTFDIKDVMLNAAGGAAGCGLFWLFCRAAAAARFLPDGGHGPLALMIRVARNCAAGRSSLAGIERR